MTDGEVSTPRLTVAELLTLRCDMDLTQEEFARYLEVSLATVSRWELNKQPISRLASNYVRLLAERWYDAHPRAPTPTAAPATWPQ